MTKFPDLATAGRELALALEEFRDARDTVVVGIATAGVPVAAELARVVQLPLELLIIRRLLVPDGGEDPVCAVSVAGTVVLDERLGSLPRTPGMDHSIADGLEQLGDRERAFRGERGPVDVAGMNVVLVDNGIHTGGTMLIAIRALRRLNVGSIVVAVPVANALVRSAIYVDRIVCLAWSENFGHVGMWYRHLVRPTPEEIRAFFEDRCDKVTAHE